MKQPRNVFRILTIMHLSMLTGLALFALVCFVISRYRLASVVDESFSRIFQVVVIVISLSFLIIGLNVFRKKILAARSSSESAEKRMELYLSACIIWWAMIQVPGILAIVGFLLTLNHSFLFLGLFHLLLLFVFMPRKENIIILLNLNSEEVMKLEGKS